LKAVSLSIRSNEHSQVILIRGEVEDALEKLAAKDGLCHLWCPHTTAALTVNEGADPDVAVDFLKRLEELVPWQAGYRHAEGNSAAHIKSIIVGPSLTLPVQSGRLALGTWQNVYLCEFDGPRRRTLDLRFLPD